MPHLNFHDRRHYIRSKSEPSLSYAFINSPHLLLTKVTVLHLLHIIWNDQVKILKTFYDHCPKSDPYQFQCPKPPLMYITF